MHRAPSASARRGGPARHRDNRTRVPDTPSAIADALCPAPLKRRTGHLRGGACQVQYYAMALMEAIQLRRTLLVNKTGKHPAPKYPTANTNTTNTNTTNTDIMQEDMILPDLEIAFS